MNTSGCRPDNRSFRFCRTHSNIVMMYRLRRNDVCLTANDVVHSMHHDVMFALIMSAGHIIGEANIIAQATSFAAGKHH